jgi:elongation factor G
MPDDSRTQPLLVEIAIEPKSKAEQEKLRFALAKLAAEDSSFQVSSDQESGQTILKGTSEFHLDAKLDMLRRTYKIDPNVGTFQVAFRERPTKRAEVEYAHKKIEGTRGEFAVVKLVVAPNEPGKGNVFESRIVGGALPKEYIGGVEKGLESAFTCGVMAGYPVVDVKVELIDGKYHDVDSSVQAFEIASRAACREALHKAASVLLEPIMRVELLTPEAYVGSLVGDLNSRRGQIRARDMRGRATVIHAMVPLINTFGQADALRLMSEGRAISTMQFDHYAPVPLPDDDPPPPFRPAIGMRA